MILQYCNICLFDNSFMQCLLRDNMQSGDGDWNYLFWKDIIQIGEKSDFSFYSKFKPRRSKAIQAKTNTKGVFLCFRIRKNHGEVTVTIENVGHSRSLSLFQQIRASKVKFSELIKKPLKWAPANERTATSRIIATVQFSSNIDSLKREMIKTMEEFRLAFMPVINQLDSNKPASQFQNVGADGDMREARDDSLRKKKGGRKAKEHQPKNQISDSVVMGDVHQNIGGKECPGCSAYNVRIMNCKENECTSIQFCELCNTNSRWEDGVRLRFNSGKGTGPFCSGCLEDKEKAKKQEEFDQAKKQAEEQAAE